MANNIKRIGVFTSGGDAPGMNAAIRAVVRTASYHDLHVHGINRGYQGMIEGDITTLNRPSVGQIIQRGGTILKTARSEDFRTKEGRKQAYESLSAHGIDACIAIGGNGTFTGAKIFQEEYDIPFIGLPGTIDNDIYGTDFTIGFDTAVNTAVEALDKIRDTADSHNRLFFVEVMGRHSGYIALYTGICTGAGSIFLPEEDNDIDYLVKQLKKSTKRKKLFNLVVVAEGNQNGGAYEIARKVNEQFDGYETKVTVIGHQQRGGSPTAADRLLASRLGHESVNALIDGKKGLALGVVNDKISYTTFDDAINKTKEPSKDMIRMAEILAL
jgi:6-phosphofructokinase 1